MIEKLKAWARGNWKEVLFVAWAVWGTWQIRQIREEMASYYTVDRLSHEVSVLREEVQSHSQEEEAARKREELARLFRSR